MSYHDYDGWVSNSMRRCFAESPVQFHWQYILGNRAAPTAQQILGQYVHGLLAGDQSGFAIFPDVDRRTKDGKAAWAEFVAESADKQVVTAEQCQSGIMMADATMKHPTIARILQQPDRITEQEFRGPAIWAEAVQRKCKPDVIWHGIVVDYKTTTDPSPDAFRRAIANWGYHQQAAWYLETLRECNVDVKHFLFVAIQSAEPWEVCCYYLPQAAIDVGHQQNMREVEALAACIKSDEWFCRRHVEIEELDLPAWAYRRDV